MAFKDYYEILEIKPDASEDEIKKAYRKLAKRFHPDKNTGNPYAIHHFREIQEAYEVLSNPVRRSEYHQLRWRSYGQQFRFSASGSMTPEMMLQEAINLKKALESLDIFRMDKDAWRRRIEQLLTDRHIEILTEANKPVTNRKFVLAILDCTRPIPYPDMSALMQKLVRVSGTDNELIIDLHRAEMDKRNQFLWDKYKGILMVLIALAISYLIYRIA